METIEDGKEEGHGRGRGRATSGSDEKSRRE
jgi:hypothetical protein